MLLSLLIGSGGDAPPGLQLEIDRCRVYLEPQSKRSRSISKHMAEMSIALYILKGINFDYFTYV